jgi:predicted GIY-YIG superfamily endonuclease
MSTTTPEPEVGTIYLLHFERPYHHARRYLGWTTNLTARLDAHTTGRGARLITVITHHGIGFTLARTWTGTRTRERRLKNQGGHTRHCPLCHTTPNPAKPIKGNRDGKNH